MLAETKLDFSFPSVQFLITGFHHTFTLDINGRSGDLLVLAKGRVLTFFYLPIDIKTIPFKIDLRKEKWLFVSI